MNICLYCGNYTSNPKFCNRSCSASFNNKITKLKLPPNCLYCQKFLARGRVYCTNKCQQLYQYAENIRKWKAGNRSVVGRLGQTTKWIRKYLREKYNNRCCMCGWNKVNPHTKIVPLVVDHIDGDSGNDKEENLRLICWNCDSLGSTFGGQNKGNGRTIKYGRKVIYIKA